MPLKMSVCVCVRVRVCVCVCICFRACVRACDGASGKEMEGGGGCIHVQEFVIVWLLCLILYMCVNMCVCLKQMHGCAYACIYVAVPMPICISVK